jgi:biopolymer transport protein ExbB
MPAILCGVAVALISTTLLAANEPAPASSDSNSQVEAKNILQLYRAGGFFMIPLTACSVLAVAIIIERFAALRRGAVIPPGFLNGLRRVAKDLREDREQALGYCRENDSPMARMLAAGIKRMPRGHDAAEKAIEDAGANEALKLRRNMRLLYAIGSVATLLGLIGTISGMIKAFQSAAASGTPDVNRLSTGIYEAMVNTFGGLAVAIVVTIFYYFFVGRIEKLISEMNDLLANFSDEYGFNAESDTELKVTNSL